MADIDLKLDNIKNGAFDIVIENGILVYENTYRSHIINSLFENQRLPQSLAKNKPHFMRGGSPAEILLNYDGFKRGSLLWTLIYKTTVNNGLVKQIQSKSEIALKWLVENNFVKDVSVLAEIISPTSIQITVNLVNNNNSNSQEIFTDINLL